MSTPTKAARAAYAKAALPHATPMPILDEEEDASTAAPVRGPTYTPLSFSFGPRHLAKRGMEIPHAPTTQTSGGPLMNGHASKSPAYSTPPVLKGGGSSSLEPMDSISSTDSGPGVLSLYSPFRGIDSGTSFGEETLQGQLEHQTPLSRPVATRPGTKSHSSAPQTPQDQQQEWLANEMLRAQRDPPPSAPSPAPACPRPVKVPHLNRPPLPRLASFVSPSDGDVPSSALPVGGKPRSTVHREHITRNGRDREGSGGGGEASVKPKPRLLLRTRTTKVDQSKKDRQGSCLTASFHGSSPPMEVPMTPRNHPMNMLQSNWNQGRHTSSVDEDNDDSFILNAFGRSTSIGSTSQHHMAEQHEHVDRGKALRQLHRPGKSEKQSHGALQFKGTQRAPAKWCAIPPTARVDDVIGLLLNTWGLTSPDVIISITGAAAGDIPDLDARQKQV